MQPAGKREIAEAGVTALVVALAAGVGEMLSSELWRYLKRRQKQRKKAAKEKK